MRSRRASRLSSARQRLRQRFRRRVVAIEVEASRAVESVAAWVLGSPPEPINSGDGNLPDNGRLAVVASLEVRQGNRTLFVLPGLARGFDPQPESPTQR